MHVRWMVVAGLFGALALGGCASEDGGDPSWVSEYDFIYEDVAEPYPDQDVAACEAFAEADEGTQEDQTERRACFCNECFTLMRQCDALPGCAEMRRCAWDSGCRSPNACYLLPGAPCRAVIDKWGNGSVSAAINTELGMCECE